MATSTLGSGTLVLAGTTSGTTTVTATAVAGTTTLTLPAATDTLVGKATTDTLTNKTLTTPSVSSPTISDGTANGVAYLNGSKVLTTGSALVFDGTSMILGGTSPTTSSGYTSFSINNATNSGYLILQSNGTNKSDWFVSSGTVATLRGVSVPLSLESTGANHIKFETNGTEAARIDSSGNFLAGNTVASSATNAGFKFLKSAEGAGNDRTAIVFDSSSNSQIPFTLYSTGAGAYRFYVGAGGTISATSTSITAISDQRLKENIRDLDDGLASVLALKPRKFDWKEGKGANIKDARGFIAQEFETVFPDMIEQWLDPAPEGEEPYKAVNANLIPTLVKAIQEQQALITQLTARITALESA